MSELGAKAMAVIEIAIALAVRPGRAATRGVTATNPVPSSMVVLSGTASPKDWYTAATVLDYSKAARQSARTDQS